MQNIRWSNVFGKFVLIVLSMNWDIWCLFTLTLFEDFLKIDRMTERHVNFYRCSHLEAIILDDEHCIHTCIFTVMKLNWIKIELNHKLQVKISLKLLKIDRMTRLQNATSILIDFLTLKRSSLMMSIAPAANTWWPFLQTTVWSPVD